MISPEAVDALGPFYTDDYILTTEEGAVMIIQLVYSTVQSRMDRGKRVVDDGDLPAVGVPSPYPLLQTVCEAGNGAPGSAP